MAPWREIDTGDAETARAILSRACGSTRWVDRMMARRPFVYEAKLLFAARNEWFGLTEADWLEAFSHHPKIGDRASLVARFPSTHDLSAKEQAKITALRLRQPVLTLRAQRDPENESGRRPAPARAGGDHA